MPEEIIRYLDGYEDWMTERLARYEGYLSHYPRLSALPDVLLDDVYDLIECVYNGALLEGYNMGWNHGYQKAVEEMKLRHKSKATKRGKASETLSD